jgi:repressor LexA
MNTVMVKQHLTRNEKRVIAYIQLYLESNKMYPTYREIQNHLDLRSINSISQYIKQLEYKGVLRLIKNKGYRVYQEQREQADLINLSILGTVQAGDPTSAGLNSDNISLPASFVKHPENTFALRVRGNSMSEAGIHEGDVVIVEKRPKAFNTEIVVALVNNENTVKRYIRHEDGSRYLKAESPSHNDIIPEGDWVLQGVVVGLWREY